MKALSARYDRPMSSRSTALLLASFLAAVHAPLEGQAPAKDGPPPIDFRFGGLLQVQADGGDRGDSRFPDTDVRLYLRRARASATARLPQGFELKAEVELAGSLSSTSNLRAQLTDAYVGWKGKGSLQVRAGQFKTPFGYEQLLPDPRMTTIERGLGNDRLTPGRQVGVQLHGDLAGKRLSWAVGAFGGSGVNTTTNEDGGLLWAGRLAGTAWKGALAGADATLSIGANGFTSEEKGLAMPADFLLDSTPLTLAFDNLLTGRRSGVGLDAELSAGRLEAAAEVLLLRFGQEGGGPGRDFDATSASLLAGWEVVAKRLQLFARYDAFDPSRERDGDDTTTLTFGGSWFLRGHDLKLQANVLSADVPGRSREVKVLARLQAAF